MSWCCAECDNLDKTRKEWNETHYCYRYGCKARGKHGYICFWCLNDKDLKSGGCSDFAHTEYEQFGFF